MRRRKMFTTKLVPDLEYVDGFLSPKEEEDLERGIQDHPHAWRMLRNRRLQNWGGLPHIKGMLPTSLPKFLNPIVNRLDDYVFQPNVSTRPNHVLVNQYEPGQGIDAHVDGPAYQPCAAIISLSAPIVMRFYPLIQSPKESAPAAEATSEIDSDSFQNAICSLLLRPRSLLLLKGHAYHNVRHGIMDVPCDYINNSVVNALPEERGLEIPRKQRTSLTVRASIRTISNPLLGRRRVQ